MNAALGERSPDSAGVPSGASSVATEYGVTR
jgi:hypothetical protein